MLYRWLITPPPSHNRNAQIARGDFPLRPIRLRRKEYHGHHRINSSARLKRCPNVTWYLWNTHFSAVVTKPSENSWSRYCSPHSLQHFMLPHFPTLWGREGTDALGWMLRSLPPPRFYIAYVVGDDSVPAEGFHSISLGSWLVQPRISRSCWDREYRCWESMERE